jgi:LacI family transcriptional regulator
MIGGGHATSSALNRRAGFLAAMKNNNIPSDSTLVIDCGGSPEDGEEGLRKALKVSPPPTAVVCLTDQIALGVISGLHFMNLTPGRDLAIAGCEDIIDASRGYMQLTTARVRKSKIGETAAEMLLERIENPNLPHRNILFKSELIVRKSCGS